MTGVLYAVCALVAAWLDVLAVLGTVGGAAILNRAAGGGWTAGPDGGSGTWLGAQWFGLRGKPVFYTAPILGLLAWCWVPAHLAAPLALANLVWRLPEWGRWYTMGRLPIGWGRAGKAPSRFERAVEAISFGNGRIAMFWRFLATAPGIAPLAWAVDPTPQTIALFVFGSAAALWLAYEAGWQVYERFQKPGPNGGIPNCELIAGGVWGFLILALAI